MKRIISLFILLAVIILELLPYGAVLNFAPAPGETIRQTFSYFSLVPFGYANFGPFLTAILSCILIFLSLIHLLKGKGKRAIFTASFIAFISSLLPLMFGFSYMTGIGIIISALLLANMIFLTI